MDDLAILKRPIITEKTLRVAKEGFFTFEVALKATKRSVIAAVEKTFSVDVIKIATMVIKGKTRRTGRKRTAAKVGLTKKAVIQLKKDQKIDLFDIGS